MCTMICKTAAVQGQGKGQAGWIALTHVHVAYDHPVQAPFEHALMLDFVNEAAGPEARLVVELSPEAARALLRTIEEVLVAAEAQSSVGAPAGAGER
jgi:hypothetical protein